MLMPEGRLPEKLAVGIFLCEDMNEKCLQALTENLLADVRVSRVLIRPHPKNLFVEFNDWLASLNDSRVGRSSSDAVFRDLRETAVVFGGNSSVLIEAVTDGRFSVYVPGLDYGSPDLHEFVARGLIYPIDKGFKLDFDAISRFYRRAEWLSVLRLFANIDEDEATVKTQIMTIMREFGGRITK